MTINAKWLQVFQHHLEDRTQKPVRDHVCKVVFSWIFKKKTSLVLRVFEKALNTKIQVVYLPNRILFHWN